MSDPVSEPLCTSAAAYVLGALPASERAGFEEHLADCRACQESVRDLAGIPGLLSRVSPADLEQPPVPPTLAPGLLAAVRRGRRRRRRTVVAALAAAAVVVAVLGTFALLDRTETDPPGIAMAQVVESPIHARVRLVGGRDGTRVVFECRYDALPGGAYARLYALVVVDSSGVDHDVVTWQIAPGHDFTSSSTVSLAPGEIDEVEVRAEDGTALLRLDASRAR